ncbi:5'-nucleotidase C-terminal domain-containing protein [Lutibacter sp.]|uniref:5'-nucleotidase C-terminal domain-containing protein n=1 Tax=Lutibacter sp. TaxID=1925666 RepID=UPI0035644E9B
MKKFIISFIIFLALFSCKSQLPQLVKIEGKQTSINEIIASDKIIENTIKPYRDKVEKEMTTVISYTPINLNRTDGDLESSLGNLMADLCYQRANPVFNSRTGKSIDFAMFNYGGIRSGISKGDITNENAFNLMPFENSLVVVELTSEKIKELVDYLISQNKAHPLSKHINLVITDNGYTLKINNAALDTSKTYFVLTSDYLQNGGDNMNFFKNPVNLYKIDYKVRNAIIDYLKETDTLKVTLDGRFSHENAPKN